MSRPFIIAVASEKGGVGKTTIATNLTVYLKALHEDLPVTIASFDNHFSVDQMFALGPRPEGSVADLLGDRPFAEVVTLGQYGVQYIASSRRLEPPLQSPDWLRQRLCTSGIEGILVLDTRPILDWFTEAALLAADLVLVPIKDRAALINASTLRKVLADVGRIERLWLIPSLVDSRARLNAEVRVHEFLRFAAQERDYQMVDTVISKSPKVESLASGFSSRIRPVLTHARNTMVHGQFKALAEFVLARFNERTLAAPDSLGAQSIGHRRQLAGCPVCAGGMLDQSGHFLFDLRSRRRGFIHPECLEQLLEGLDLESFDVPGAILALTLDGPGLMAPDCRLTVHLCDIDGNLIVSEGVDLEGRSKLTTALSVMTGRSLNHAYRELVLLQTVAQPVVEIMAEADYRSFAQKRRRVIRELRHSGLF